MQSLRTINACFYSWLVPIRVGIAVKINDFSLSVPIFERTQLLVRYSEHAFNRRITNNHFCRCFVQYAQVTQKQYTRKCQHRRIATNHPPKTRSWHANSSEAMVFSDLSFRNWFSCALRRTWICWWPLFFLFGLGHLFLKGRVVATPGLLFALH